MRPIPSKPEAIERVAKKLGFVKVHQKGSHAKFKHADGRSVIIPFYGRDVSTGTLRQIVFDMGITIEAFNRMV